ncbi:MAG: 3-phosphoshikimate 1-carboxyvinyltransferase [Gemmatimonadota bacterium]|nr:3-phosphoshikimate 1-carboxyvinyltransferase [Gemmatimonadota bacterium]
MRVTVPGDKSLTQRALILSALASGESRLRGLLHGGDAASTRDALARLGAAVPAIPGNGGEVVVRGVGLGGLRDPGGELDLGNSGTGTRLLLGVLAGTELHVHLTGDTSLRTRPMRRVTEPLHAMGATFTFHEIDGKLPLTIRGRHPLAPIDWESPVASAQVKSAILLAGLTGGAFALVTEPRKSRDHTERLFSEVGVGVISHAVEGGWRVELRDPPERIRPLDFEVPGDFSSAAFLLAFAVLGGGAPDGLTVERVGLNPTRTAFLDVLDRMGARLTVEADRHDPGAEPRGSVTASGSALRATTVDGEEVPRLIDELPLVAALGARAAGTTRIRGAAELRAKESDRIVTMVENLRAVGARAEELEDGLEVEGADGPLRGKVRTAGDHRIAMAFGVLGALPGNEIEIDDPGAADVSFPGFWAALARLGEGAAGPRAAGSRDRPNTTVGEANDPGGPRADGGPREGPIVTLDGPAGSGKSSTARAVAEALGFRHLDSGALYRALTYALLRSEIPTEQWHTLSESDLDALDVRAIPTEEGFDVRVMGRSVVEELRTPEVTEHVAMLAGLPAARASLIELQRMAGRRGRLVADGRDLGTVVFPDAEVKVFLVADLEERARRRLAETGTRDPDERTLQLQMEQIAERDRHDSERRHAPLRESEDAHRIDTTGLPFDRQVKSVVELVRRLTAQ